MAYDHALADALRAALADRDDVVERPMFGGLSFMVAGSLALSARSGGGLLARVHPDDAEEFAALPGAGAATMRGRAMSPGWIDARPDRLDAAGFDRLVRAAVEYAEAR